jgi:hypothetical protein
LLAVLTNLCTLKLNDAKESAASNEDPHDPSCVYLSASGDNKPSLLLYFDFYTGHYLLSRFTIQDGFEAGCASDNKGGI